MIYTVTSIKNNKNLDWSCMGYFLTLKEAIDSLKYDVTGDMYGEYYYDYVVIEEVLPGYRGNTRVEYWFKREDHHWVQCTKPENLKNVVCWGIG